MYVFRRIGGTWTQVQELLHFDGAPSDGFSIVALSGDVAIVGAPNNHGAAFYGGAAYVFRRNPRTSQWEFQQKLTASDAEEFDAFGGAVAMHGNVALIGAPADDGSIIGAGSVYCFQYNGASWIETQKLHALNIGYCPLCEEDRFGSAISMAPAPRGGLEAIIGAPGDAQPGGIKGSVYFFHFDPRTSLWTQQQDEVSLPAPDGGDFGASVGIDGDWAIVGAPNNDISWPQAGAAYAFHFDGRKWTLAHSYYPPVGVPTAHGQAVAISGTTGLIGAPAAGLLAGAAYICTLEQVFADLSCDGKVDGIDLAVMLASWGSHQRGAKATPADLNGDGLVNGLDLGMLLGAWGS